MAEEMEIVEGVTWLRIPQYHGVEGEGAKAMVGDQMQIARVEFGYYMDRHAVHSWEQSGAKWR